MKRRTLLSLIPAATLLPRLAFSQEKTLTVMSYNIHHGEGNDGKLDLERIADVILRPKPDLVALQEVDNKTGRTNNVDQTTELARLTEMHGAFGSAMDYDGGQYGEAVLSRFPIQKRINHALPYTEGHEPRAALEIQVQFADETISFFGTHLDHVRNSPDRMSAALEINKIVYDLDHPMILAGDLNAVPVSDEIEELRKNWTFAGDGEDLPTIPVDNPTRQIDYIAFRPSKRWKVHEIYVIDEKIASDHLPIVAKLELV